MIILYILKLLLKIANKIHYKLLPTLPKNILDEVFSFFDSSNILIPNAVKIPDFLLLFMVPWQNLDQGVTSDKKSKTTIVAIKGCRAVMIL
jgi:hypothetical protein